MQVNPISANSHIFSEQAHSQDHSTKIPPEVVQLAAGAIAERITGGNAKHIAAALSNPDLYNSNLLEKVFRVTWSLTKTGASTCEEQIEILMQNPKNDDPILVTIRGNRPWEDLPTQVRKDFIGRHEETLTYLLFGGELSE